MMLNYKPCWQSVKYCPNLVGAAYSAREMVAPDSGVCCVWRDSDAHCIRPQPRMEE